jgi:cyclohexyl-isocyanide hydratase
MPHATVHIVFPIFNRMTHLDFTGPHAIFSSVSEAHISVASVGGADVEAQGLVFTGLADLRDVGRCDVLCIPGGAGVSAAIGNESFMQEIRRLGRTARYLTSVCTGSLILGAAGFLRGKRATTHWATRHLLAELGAIFEKARVVRDGNVITGGGVTAGIDFGLVTIAEIFGRDVAEAIELRLEYAPQPPFGVGMPEQAPDELVGRVRAALRPVVEENARSVKRAAAALMA